MKKFIYKALLFVLPFMLLYGTGRIFSSTRKGDLLRMSALIDRTGNYHQELDLDFCAEDKVLKLDSVLEKDFADTSKIKVLTLGDSYSLMGKRGYQNALAKDEQLSVVDYSTMQDPSAALIHLLESNTLQKLKPDYLIFQSVERRLPHHLEQLKKYRLEGKFDRKDLPNKGYETGIFFSKRTLSFALNNLLYIFDDNAFTQEVYKANLNDKPFRIGDSNFLFFAKDMDDLDVRNSADFSIAFNKEMRIIAEQLAAMDIQLILLPCPDKLHFYHEYLQTPERYPCSRFFERFQADSDYIYINSLDVLKQAESAGKRDLYYWDDTHWSPIGARCIADELIRVIN